MKQVIEAAAKKLERFLNPYIVVQNNPYPKYSLLPNASFSNIKDKALIEKIIVNANDIQDLLHSEKKDDVLSHAVAYGELIATCTSKTKIGFIEPRFWGDPSMSDLQNLTKELLEDLMRSKTIYDEEAQRKYKQLEEENKKIKADMVNRDRAFDELSKQVQALQTQLAQSRAGSLAGSRSHSPTRTPSTMYAPTSQKAPANDEEYLKYHFGESLGGLHFFLCELAKYEPFKKLAVNAIEERIFNYQHPVSHNYLTQFNSIKVDDSIKPAVDKILNAIGMIVSQEEQYKKSIEELHKKEQTKIATQGLHHLKPAYSILNRFKQFYVRPNSSVRWQPTLVPVIANLLENGGLLDKMTDKMAIETNLNQVQQQQFRNDNLKKEDAKLRAGLSAPASNPPTLATH